MIDNFETGQADKWYHFGNSEMMIDKNPSLEAGARDTIADSCGDYSLKLRGRANYWYAGGIGTVLNADVSPFSRFQMDVCGSGTGGRIKIELFRDDKWVAEVPILGSGFTRVSIPLTAFKLEKPGSVEAVWDANQKAATGSLSKVQFVLLTEKETGEVAANIDNILLTY